MINVWECGFYTIKTLSVYIFLSNYFHCFWLLQEQLRLGFTETKKTMINIITPGFRTYIKYISNEYIFNLAIKLIFHRTTKEFTANTKKCR